MGMYTALIEKIKGQKLTQEQLKVIGRDGGEDVAVS
jgi:hypothetical protein